jgi:hypothetical protein
MTLAESDAVPQYIEIKEPQLFQKDEIKAVIAPQNLQRGILERADIFVLRMIADAFPERPIYFSRTSANYGETLGLGNYLLTQGLARKLLTHQPNSGRDTLQVQGQGFVDVPRTTALWNTVFTAQASLIKKGDWVDRPSVGIPYLYVATGLLLSDAMAYRGENAARTKVLDTTRQLAKAMRLGDIGEAPEPVPQVADTVAKTKVPTAPAKSAPAAKGKAPAGAGK